MIQRAAAAALLAALSMPGLAEARITRLEIERTEPAFGGRAFGSVGAYQRLIGKAHGEVDPALPGNAIIQDIALAPRNARGMVEYVTDIEILRPAVLAQGSGVLLVDVPNRGNKRLLGTYNIGAGLRNDNAEAGDGFLQERGMTLVFVAWQPDVAPGDGRMTMTVPVARNPDGTPITGVVRSELVTAATRKTLNLSSGHFTTLTHTSYPTVSTDNRAALPDGFRPTLTVRAREQDPRVAIPNEDWSFANCEGAAPRASETEICLPAGFQPGRLYELTYRARDPLVLGLGYAALRDVASFLKNEREGNPAYREGQVALLHGTSQSGRNMRLFLHLGFNADEQGRRAYDGMIPHIGGGLAAMNIRFAQPGRAWGEQVDHLYPAYDYPFAYGRVADPVTGRNQGVLDRCDANNTCPRIVHAATALEMWEGRQSLGLTDPLGERDLAEHPSTRTYIMASTQHGAWTQPMPKQPPFGLCQQQPNPNPQIHTMRALLVALTDWVARDVAPPPSAHPRLADGTLVKPEEVRFPAIPSNAYGGTERPAVRFLRVTNPLRVLDFGPGYDAANSSGVISQEPPRQGDREYGLRVPQVDADGNDLAGVRSVTLRVPVGTYTGWNLGRAGRFEDGFCSLSGSHIPFAATRAEREAAGDARPSLEERYPDRAGYVAKVRAAAEELVRDRFLLPQDAAAIVAAAERDGPRAHP